MFRVRLCEFVASKFSFRNLKNKTAKSQGTLIEITGIEQNISNHIPTIIFYKLPKLLHPSTGSNAFNDKSAMLLQVNFIYIGVPKKSRA